MTKPSLFTNSSHSNWIKKLMCSPKFYPEYEVARVEFALFSVTLHHINDNVRFLSLKPGQCIPTDRTYQTKIRGAFNMFPDFFVRAFKIVVDSWKCRGCPRGVIVKAMDCGIVVREFVLQSRYYVHFRANTLGKGMKPLYPPIYGLNSTTTVLLGEWLWH